MIKELREVGLTENEAKIYVCLVENGEMMAGGISRKTGMHRRSVYDSIEMLIKKGLVGYILKNNRRFYRASNPERILEIVKEKERKIELIVPKLKEKYSGNKEKEDTHFFRGKEGLKTIFEEQLDSKEILIMGASPRAYDILQFYFHWFDKKRKKRKVRAKIIATDRSFKDIPFSEIKYLEQKYSPVSFNVYGDKVAIIMWASEPFAILIKNKEISEEYRNYFNLMWKVAKE